MLKEEKNKSIRRSQKRRKLDAVEKFGGKCKLCGYNKCIEALEFHHLDESKKEANPSHVIMKWSWERAKKELEKCILLCANCQREVHAEEHKTDLNLRVHITSWIEKECEYCKNKFDTKEKDQKFCSTSCSSFFRRKVVRPSKEELGILLKEKSFCAIGRQFGVSDNAVRKWMKKYGI